MRWTSLISWPLWIGNHLVPDFERKAPVQQVLGFAKIKDMIAVTAALGWAGFWSSYSIILTRYGALKDRRFAYLAGLLDMLKTVTMRAWCADQWWAVNQCRRIWRMTNNIQLSWMPSKNWLRHDIECWPPSRLSYQVTVDCFDDSCIKNIARKRLKQALKKRCGKLFPTARSTLTGDDIPVKGRGFFSYGVQAQLKA